MPEPIPSEYRGWWRIEPTAHRSGAAHAARVLVVLVLAHRVLLAVVAAASNLESACSCAGVAVFRATRSTRQDHLQPVRGGLPLGRFQGERIRVDREVLRRLPVP